MTLILGGDLTYWGGSKRLFKKSYERDGCESIGQNLQNVDCVVTTNADIH